MKETKEGEWIYEDDFISAGLSFADIAMLNTFKGFSEPSGFIENPMALRLIFPDSETHKKRLAEIISQGKVNRKVRILASSKWWFPERCSEKLGKIFKPESRRHIEVLKALLEEGIHPSEVPHFDWRGLHEVPMKQSQKLSYNELIALIKEKTISPYAGLIEQYLQEG